MTDLMRNDLRPLFESARSAHAGLLMQRGLVRWEEGDKPTKQALIKTISNVQADELYFLAFKRWLALSHGEDGFANLSAKIDGRLFIGLALGGTLETGVMTHHTYGVPMIAGSSVKGAVRSYAEQLFAVRDDNGRITYHDGQAVIPENKQAIFDILFGAESDDEASAGYLIWHDAWWIPPTTKDLKLSTGEQNKPFVSEVVTVHHQAYYNDTMKEALDIENPIPNQQLAVQGDFYFCIEGTGNWTAFAKQLLENMLKDQGVGAKGSNGYGYFVMDANLEKTVAKLADTQKPIDTLDPLANIRLQVRLVQSELVKKLSKDSNRFFRDLDLDKQNAEDRKKVVRVVLEEFHDIVETWGNQNSTNAQRAYEFVQNNR